MDLRPSPLSRRRRVAMLASIDRESDEYLSSVWVARTDGSSPPRRFSYGPKKDASPRWSPDGERLLFVSDRADKPQLYVAPSDGGEARRVSVVENGVEQPEWSPDGRRVAFVSKVGVKADEELKDVLTYHYTEAHFKDDGVGIKRGRNHLFVQEIAPEGEDRPEAVQLTHGEDDYSEPAWSPDGRTIAATSSQGEEREFGWLAVYLVPSDGGEPRRISPENGVAATPVYSPDGSSLAYLGHHNPPETA
ncbi:MAG: hypothetical protein WKH64_05005 [Chloroflexia bacterium]